MSFTDDTARRLLASKAEQAAIGSEDLAKMLGAFRRELTEQGFEHDQVWELCREYFNAVLDNSGDDTEE